MQNQEEDFSSSKSKGDALEQNVEYLFKTAKFKTSRNVKKASYEIDVLAELGDRRIVIECKNYQSSSVTIRNLLHQWSSKNRIINAHKVILVIARVTIKESDKELANSLDISLWGEEDLAELFKESLKPETFRQKLLDNISLRPLSISERYSLDISIELCGFAFSPSKQITSELKYYRLIPLLRSFILTELEMLDTDSILRNAHIDLFELTKITKGGRFSGDKRLGRQEYWKSLKQRLTSSEANLIGIDENIRGRYLGYMLELEREWDNQQALFFESEPSSRYSTHLLYRIMLSIITNTSFSFSAYTNQNSEIRVDVLEDGFLIEVPRISEAQAETLEWILTSSYFKMDKDISNGADRFLWYSSNIHDLREKLQRILFEFHRIDDDDSLCDTSVHKLILQTRTR